MTLLKTFHFIIFHVEYKVGIIIKMNFELGNILTHVNVRVNDFCVFIFKYKVIYYFQTQIIHLHLDLNIIKLYFLVILHFMQCNIFRI